MVRCVKVVRHNTENVRCNTGNHDLPDIVCIYPLCCAYIRIKKITHTCVIRYAYNM